MLKMLRCPQKPWHSYLKGDDHSLLLLLYLLLDKNLFQVY